MWAQREMNISWLIFPTTKIKHTTFSLVVLIIANNKKKCFKNTYLIRYKIMHKLMEL